MEFNKRQKQFKPAPNSYKRKAEFENNALQFQSIFTNNSHKNFNKFPRTKATEIYYTKFLQTKATKFCYCLP